MHPVFLRSSNALSMTTRCLGLISSGRWTMKLECLLSFAGVEFSIVLSSLWIGEMSCLSSSGVLPHTVFTSLTYLAISTARSTSCTSWSDSSDSTDCFEEGCSFALNTLLHGLSSELTWMVSSRYRISYPWFSKSCSWSLSCSLACAYLYTWLGLGLLIHFIFFFLTPNSWYTFLSNVLFIFCSGNYLWNKTQRSTSVIPTYWLSVSSETR